MSCRTMFHDLLYLVKTHVPAENRADFYHDLLMCVKEHNVNLDFLLGEDDLFDHAHKKVNE